MTNNDFDDQADIKLAESVRSRSQIKRDMAFLQKIGERLVELSDDQIQTINIPGELREAVLSAKEIKSHGAKKRHLKFIGALMRKVDISPVSEALHEIDRGRGFRTAEFHVTEDMRDELLKGNDDRIDSIVEKYPNADRQKLRQLVRNARKESKENKPPKSSSELFRYIKKLLEDVG